MGLLSIEEVVSGLSLALPFVFGSMCSSASSVMVMGTRNRLRPCFSTTMVVESLDSSFFLCFGLPFSEAGDWECLLDLFVVSDYLPVSISTQRC